MSKKIVNVTSASFETEVLRNDLPVIVDFYADWCPPCRMLSPMLERLAIEFEDKIKFVKIDSDAEKSLAALYQVTGLPTVVFMDSGENVGQFAGLPQEEAFRNQLQKWLESKTIA